MFIGFCPLGHFWQLTDLHWDQQYRTDGDPTGMCHTPYGPDKLSSTYQSKDPDHMSAGQYGMYSCDAPWDLIEFSIRGMAENSAIPDFIIWTGFVIKINAPPTLDLTPIVPFCI